jgi:hypothetical protein
MADLLCYLRLQNSQQQELALEQRVQRLEDALTSLDHDVRVRLGIGESALGSHPDLLQGPDAPDAQRVNTLDPSRAKTR